MTQRYQSDPPDDEVPYTAAIIHLASLHPKGLALQRITCARAAWGSEGSPAAGNGLRGFVGRSQPHALGLLCS